MFDVPLGKLMQQPGALTEDNVLFYCEMGQRSAVACEFAASVGLEHVYNLEGGMTAWRQLEGQVAIQGGTKAAEGSLSLCHRVTPLSARPRHCGRPAGGFLASYHSR